MTLMAIIMMITTMNNDDGDGDKMMVMKAW